MVVYRRNSRQIAFVQHKFPWQPDYVVTGDPNPDCKGNYFEDGIHDGKMSYRRSDNAWYVWWRAILENWFISETKGDTSSIGWWRHNPNIEGTYIPQLGAAGNPIVTAF